MTVSHETLEINLYKKKKKNKNNNTKYVFQPYNLLVLRSQTFRLTAENLESMAAFIGRDASNQAVCFVQHVG